MCHAHGASIVSYVWPFSAHPYFFYRWGSMYDCSDPKIRGHTLHLAVLKLLFDSSHPRSLSFTAAQYCAVLSQRLAIDINSTTYLTGGSTRNFDMTGKVQAQIANHMRVCIATREDLATVQS